MPRDCPDGVTFDEARHVYTLDGRVVPGVSSIIKPLVDYSAISQATLDAAAERGRDVHTATHLDDLGILDESTVSPEVAPYLMAWRKFRTEKRPKWTRRESIVASRTHQYAGTLDCEGVLDNLRVVGEIKTTSAVYPAFGVQLAGYSIALCEMTRTHSPQARVVIQLRADGNYRLHWYRDPADRAAFISMLNVYHWKGKHGLAR